MRWAAALTLAALASATACGGGGDGAAPTGPARSVTVLTHDGFAVSTEVLEQFEAETGIAIDLQPVGDRAALVEAAVLAAGTGTADVLFGVDSTLLTDAIRAEVFAPYDAPGLAAVPPELLARPEEGAIPVSYGDVCVVVDRGWFSAQGLPPPDEFADLVAPQYAGMLAVPDPATTTEGLAFLLATVAWYGDGDDNGFGWQGFWEALLADDVEIVASAERAYHGAFTGGSAEGDRPLTVGEGTSPAAELLLGATAGPTPALAVLGDTCFRHVEYAGVARSAADPAAARRVVDLFLSDAFQSDLPLSMLAYPASSTATVPDELATLAPPVPQPLWIDPDDVGRQQRRLLREWTALVDEAAAAPTEETAP